MKDLIFTIQTINMKLAVMLTTHSGGIYIMGTNQPIKNKKDITALKEYFLTEDFNLRNYTLITMGINTALRISDILALRWKDVYNTDEHSFRSHLNKREQKTGKSTCIALNQSVIQALTLYRNRLLFFMERHLTDLSAVHRHTAL